MGGKNYTVFEIIIYCCSKEFLLTRLSRAQLLWLAQGASRSVFHLFVQSPILSPPPLHPPHFITPSPCHCVTALVLFLFCFPMPGRFLFPMKIAYVYVCVCQKSEFYM
eukprot:GEMP01082283.1.p1 GENE.GEMP01082283.1~~GEMP01082283.1.p1  ORF type:complete len:108 (+),score=0.98 GEMP01082283.1:95-418(+)